jgi:DNA-binding Lrp family transcriptional regulator
MDRSESEVLARIEALCKAGIVTRLGVIVRHRGLGWTSNAMAVWDVAPENILAAGKRLAALPGITLCYQRRTEDVWPYALYTMVHAKSRTAALAVIQAAAALPELSGVARKVLFSTHCYKQTGAWLHRKEAA